MPSISFATCISMLCILGLLLNQLRIANKTSVVPTKEDQWIEDPSSFVATTVSSRVSTNFTKLYADGTSTTIGPSPVQDCSSYNSHEWLYAGTDRISNNADGMDENYVTMLMEPNLLRHVTKLTDQTFCHRHGNFGSGSIPPAKQWNASDDDLIRAWNVKLIYLAIHALFHEPAYQEFQLRKHALSSSTATSSCSNIPLFDYECKNMKYLVTNIPSEGLGAAVRMGAMGSVMMALATNRIPLFITNATVGPNYIAQPWAASSCLRGDYQCILHPMTPCTIRRSELKDAPVLDWDDIRPIRVQGMIQRKWLDQKILIVPTGSGTIRLVRSLQLVKNRIHTKALELIAQYTKSTSEDWSEHRRRELDVLTKAAQIILANTKDNNDER